MHPRQVTAERAGSAPARVYPYRSLPRQAMSLCAAVPPAIPEDPDMSLKPSTSTLSSIPDRPPSEISSSERMSRRRSTKMHDVVIEEMYGSRASSILSESNYHGRREQRRFSSVDRWIPQLDFTRGSVRRRVDAVRQKVLVQIEYEKVGNGGVRFDSGGLAEAGGAGGQKPKEERNNSAARVIRRRQSRYGISISSDSTAKMRCRQRKQLFVTRNKVCDMSLLLAIAGLIFVIIDAELTAPHYQKQLPNDEGIDKDHPISLALRSLCVLSTLLLMACLCRYHMIEVKIALIDSGADDWRVAVSSERVVKLLVELAVCAVCPLPKTGIMKWPYIQHETRKVDLKDVPVDALLAVPMFLRSYLLCRFMVLHSKQFQDAATRSIAALNRISMDFRFVIKTMMADHPLRVLVVFTVSYWICMSWMFTQCERYDDEVNSGHRYLNSMWFVMVTFMSIGYGDIVPNTYCGRTLSIATGIVGAGVSSALIAVISRKLELSRAEKHVNNFMADSKLCNQRKNAAASVLQETWFIHKYKKMLHKGDELRLRHHQRRFLHSITEFRRIKWDQRKLQEKGNTLLDVGKLHSDMHETLWEMHRTQDHFISQVDMLTQKIVELQNTLLVAAQAGALAPYPCQGNPQALPAAGSPFPQSRPDSADLSTLPMAASPSAPSFAYSRQNSVPFPVGDQVAAARLAVPQGASAANTANNNLANGGVDTLVSNSMSSPHSLQYAGGLQRLDSRGDPLMASVTTPLMQSFESDIP